MSSRASPQNRTLWWHLLVIVVASVWFESLFIHHGINPLDEGWAVYAAQRLHQGGTLYADISWAFPPGHVIPAWIGYAIDPPGIVPTRIIYAVFCVGLSLAIYLLGRRLMPARFALLAALMVALGSPQSHLYQYLFAFRYLVIPIVGLLAFARRLDTGERRWMLAAGLIAGFGVFMRLTPSFALGCAIGIAVIASDRDWRSWLRDWAWFGVGIAIVVVPVLLWFGSSVGLERFYHESVQRPLAMLQAMPWPEIIVPNAFDRGQITRAFLAVQFRTHWFLYAGYVGTLLWMWLRARTRGEKFQHVLLLAVVVFGCIYFSRSLGRSDRSHLDSALPPVCLLLAHLLHLGFRGLWSLRSPNRARPRVEYAACALALFAWIWLGSADTMLSRENRGAIALRESHEIIRTSHHNIDDIDENVRTIRRLSAPGDILLDLTASPIFYALTDRLGPGYNDVVMPGVFVSEQEELEFLARVRAAPPVLVLWPRDAFDQMESRSIEVTAPRLARWVRRHYVRVPGPKQDLKWFVLQRNAPRRSARTPNRAMPAEP